MSGQAAAGGWFLSGPQNPRLSVEGPSKAFYVYSLNDIKLLVPRAQSIYSGHLQQGQGQAGSATPQPSWQETTQSGLDCQLGLQVPVGASPDTSQYQQAQPSNPTSSPYLSQELPRPPKAQDVRASPLSQVTDFTSSTSLTFVWLLPSLCLRFIQIHILPSWVTAFSLIAFLLPVLSPCN